MQVLRDCHDAMADAAAWIECWASPSPSSATTSSSTTPHLVPAAGASSHALHLTPAAGGPGGAPPVPPASPAHVAGLSPAGTTAGGGGGGGQGGCTALAVRQYGQVTDRLSTCYSDLMYLALAYNVNVEHQPPTAARQLAPCLGPAPEPAPAPAAALARGQAQAAVPTTGQASVPAPAPALIAGTAGSAVAAAAPLLSHAAEGAYREGRWRDGGQPTHTHTHIAHRRGSSFGGEGVGKGEPDQVHDLGPLHDMLLQLPAGSTFCGRYRLTGPPALRKGQGSDGGGDSAALSVPASCLEAGGTSVTITWYRSSAEYRRQLRDLLAVGTGRQEQEGNRQEGIGGACTAGASSPLLFERIDGLQGLPPALVVLALDS